MSKLRVVIDFDGTVTNSFEEAKPFRDAYIYKMAGLLNMNLERLQSSMKIAESVVRQFPETYGWKSDGIIVAPAVSDPYLLTQASARLIMESEASYMNFPPTEEWDKFFGELFTYAYAFSNTCFKPYARYFIESLSIRTDLVIVTNSGTENVDKKISSLLGSDHGIKIVGNAKKYQLGIASKQLPVKVQVMGLNRPVYIQRQNYFDILKSLGQVDFVVGDIWELDLALPMFLNIPTVLALSEATPSWEKDICSTEKSFSSGSLLEILDHILKC